MGDKTDIRTQVQNEFVIDEGRIEALAENLSPEDLFADLISRVKEYNPKGIPEITKAFDLANNAHKDQRRKSGEPYIIHPLYVAIILADLKMDTKSIIAGILHDIIEDTDISYDDLKKEFGKTVADVVEGVTKINRVQFGDISKDELQAENLRKMFIAMSNDIRVIMVKLADRLHNMRTLKYMSPEKQVEKARETLEIFSPLAERLGISRIKVELDDLSLKYLEPEIYRDLVNQIKLRRAEREEYVQKIVKEVGEHIREAGISATIDGRVKHFFSIYKKMKNQNKTLDQIYDLFAVRIIVDDEADCWKALGVVHGIYRPMENRFKDYISVPKNNMYRSLHTTVYGENDVPFEIQIRTMEMHEMAEYGVAAHWMYKRGSSGKKMSMDDEEKFAWFRQLLDFDQDSMNNEEYLEFVKTGLDIVNEKVYAFTPNMQLKILPLGSTPVDFAYAIHTDVGNHMVRARVNGNVVPNNYKLKNNDKVEIETSPSKEGPSYDWLTFIKSPQARSKINHYFRSHNKEENIIKGKELLNSYCKSRAIDVSQIAKPAYLEAVVKKYGFGDWDTLLAAIGHGALKEGQVVNKLVELYNAEHKTVLTNEQVIASLEAQKKKTRRFDAKSGIVIEGADDVSFRFGKCCSPIPGDDIVGFVTRGKGVSIHRRDCVNITNLPDEDKARLIPADWSELALTADNSEKYIVSVSIYATNRNGLLMDITKILTEKGVSIQALSSATSKKDVATVMISFEIKSKEELNSIVEKLRQVEGVIDIERSTS